jgi:hypothetical protein
MYLRLMLRLQDRITLACSTCTSLDLVATVALLPTYCTVVLVFRFLDCDNCKGPGPEIKAHLIPKGYATSFFILNKLQ